MEVVIDSEDLKRLKSREDKYLAYMEMLSYWGEDKTEVEALLGKIAELKRENKRLKEYNGELIEKHKKDISILCEENRKLKEEKLF